MGLRSALAIGVLFVTIAFLTPGCNQPKATSYPSTTVNDLGALNAAQAKEAIVLLIQSLPPDHVTREILESTTRASAEVVAGDLWIGSWRCDLQARKFSLVLMRGASRYSFEGDFVQRAHGRWEATIAKSNNGHFYIGPQE